MESPRSFLTHLECPECHREFNADRVQTFCQDCQSPVLARYDLTAAARSFNPAGVALRPRGIWRWSEILPVRRDKFRLTLGEGDAHLLPALRLGSSLGLTQLYIKDESTNPTGSFKARGLAVAVARAMELKLREFVIPTAGNAGSALAFYAARAGVRAHVYMPKDAPPANQAEVRQAGADLQLVDGLINDAARLAGDLARKKHWFDVSTFKEPYRAEGKKTMGLELAESFNWQLPDVIVYPTGGGTGLVGMWKAFTELESMGWIGSHRPRMVSVQAEGCAPIVQAFKTGAKRADPWQNAHTLAAGLRVPVVFADRLILRVLNESKGTALSVSDTEIIQAQKELAQSEGILAAPEGAACWAGLQHLLRDGWAKTDEKIVLFNTGSGIKYL
ncbi:MAG: threonine synthase [Chloroflexi bacterium GWB2_49_20]|nr:MAG: threonine synthase [Chloroflexi bacterium GWB2_49_20]OGN79639.1 MAG: threonine synthase [Chloroflexi bacterium GWC2_49_37]OGN83049.1 MAG: threonine synthase [Chloroflexi bacterium GWD2_49_16]HCC78625.1 threonine synthase [Anaerolineae bacterium]